MINEKTLELNISHELMESLRWLGYDSVLVGLTQLQEQAKGFDAGIAMKTRVVLIQYKRGIRRREWISFHLNANSGRNQNDRLRDMSGGLRGVSFYALPRVCSWLELFIHRGHILDRTIFYDVLDVPIPAGDRRLHTTRLHPDGSISVLSKPREANHPLRWPRLLGISEGDVPPSPPRRNDSSRVQLPDLGTPLRTFLEIIESLEMTNREKANIRPLLLTPQGLKSD